MKTIKQVVLGHGAATVAIMLSCSGQPENEIGQRGGPGGDDGNVAHASPAGGGGGALQSAMPDNPAHISFRVPGMLKVQVGFASVTSYPYVITKEGDGTVVTVFLPQGMKIITMLSFMDEDGKPVSDPVMLTIDPMGKLGTYTLQPDETSKELNFGKTAQKALQIGENILDVPSSEQFVGGSTSPITQAVYTAQFDQICHLSCMGAKEMRIFRNGPAECHTGHTSFPLKEGEEVGVYVVTPGSQINIEPPHVFVEAIQMEE